MVEWSAYRQTVTLEQGPVHVHPAVSTEDRRKPELSLGAPLCSSEEAQ